MKSTDKDDYSEERSKEYLRPTFSDPTNNVSNITTNGSANSSQREQRRAQWIKDKLSRVNKDDESKPSGFSRLFSSVTTSPDKRDIEGDSCRRKVKSKGFSSWRQHGSGSVKIRPTVKKFEIDPRISLPNSHENIVMQDTEEELEDLTQPRYLSRQNGMFRPRNIHHRPSTVVDNDISSEDNNTSGGEDVVSSPSSQDISGGNLLSRHRLSPIAQPSIPSSRKQSVFFFSSCEIWNEDNILQSFRDLSPSSNGTILEASLNNQVTLLEDLLQDEDNLARLRNDQIRDTQLRTPLHVAAAMGHYETVEFLLEKGANADVFEPHHNATPLSCACAFGSFPIVDLLITKGSCDVNAGFQTGKTALHWAVQGGHVECCRKLLECGAKQNPPLIYTETPIHIASTLGDAACLAVLLEFKADVHLCKGSNRSTAIILASTEGSVECIRLLLQAGASVSSQDSRGYTPLHVVSDADAMSVLLVAGADPNMPDYSGRFALHCAVSRGSRAAECVRLLVDNGADLDAQDNFGYTSLHLAAVNENAACVSILLHKGADVTKKTKAGVSALSLLVRRIPDVSRYLTARLDSAVSIHDHDRADPDCEIRLDFRAVVPNSEKRVITPDGKKKLVYVQRKETEFLTCLLGAGNKKILSHPLSEAFLTLKWGRVRKFFWASLLFQIVLVLLFTFFVIEVYLKRCPYKHIANGSSEENEDLIIPTPRTPPPFVIIYPPQNNNSFPNLWPSSNKPNISQVENDKRHLISRREASSGFSWFRFSPMPKKKKKKKNFTEPTSTVTPESDVTNSDDIPTIKTRLHFAASPPLDLASDTLEIESGEEFENEEEENECKIGLGLTIIWFLLVAFACLMGLKEIFQLVQAPLSYVVSSENWGQWALIGSVSLTAWRTPELQPAYWQYPAAAAGIFLAWGLMLLQVGRFPALGMYVQMLGKVAANFGLFILAYACLLIAFALAFCVLFPGHPPYSSVPLAILKVVTMMVGEVDYEDLFYGEEIANDDTILYPVTAHVLHGAFVIIVTIVLMNLLVGLAVHDIQGLQKGAKLNRLSRQTALISRLESFIFSRKLQTCLPKSIGSILQKSALLVPCSYNFCYYFRPNDPRDKRLPKELKAAALKLAASRHFNPKKTHVDNARRSNSNICGGPVANDVTLRRLEQRFDKLQSQLEIIINSLGQQRRLSVMSQQQQ